MQSGNAIEEHRRQLLDEVERRFGADLAWHENMPSLIFRDDVTTHTFFDPEGRLTEDLKRKSRRWIESKGWQFSRQCVHHPSVSDRFIEYVFIAPMSPVVLREGYHATRRASLSSIMQVGLLPSIPERQTTDNRADCEGNIYLCERLGTPADAGVPRTETAHWWRAHLAENNRFHDPDWIILRVAVGQLQGARTYQDIWSKSGIILDNVAGVPPELIAVEHSQ
jgi:hypothetical protein